MRLFKKDSSQQPLTLDHSELLVLKKLAGFFLSVEFRGSQLEALLHARAHGFSSEVEASILTPPTLSSASVSDADAQAIRPSVADQRPLDPAPKAPNHTKSPSRSSATSAPRPIIKDAAFQHSTNDGTNEPVEINNFSHLAKDVSSYADVESHAFSHSTNKNTKINNHSFNGNHDSFNTGSMSTFPPRIQNYH